MGLGTWMLYSIPNAATGRKHFGGSAFPLSDFGFDTKMTIYVGLVAVAVNLLVAVIATPLMRSMRLTEGDDATVREDYFADATPAPSPAPAAPADPAPTATT